MDRQACLAGLRVLAKSTDLGRAVLVERLIDQYLQTAPFSHAYELERLRSAIYIEAVQRREGEDWSDAREYVRSLLRRMT
jgi:hypothetical protein